jgi:hypothetical protein
MVVPLKTQVFFPKKVFNVHLSTGQIILTHTFFWCIPAIKTMKSGFEIFIPTEELEHWSLPVWT